MIKMIILDEFTAFLLDTQSLYRIYETCHLHFFGFRYIILISLGSIPKIIFP